MTVDIEFTTLPKRVYGTLTKDDIVVEAGESLSQALAREIGAALNFTVPAGKRLVVSVSVRALLEEV